MPMLSLTSERVRSVLCRRQDGSCQLGISRRHLLQQVQLLANLSAGIGSGIGAFIVGKNISLGSARAPALGARCQATEQRPVGSIGQRITPALHSISGIETEI